MLSTQENEVKTMQPANIKIDERQLQRDKDTLEALADCEAGNLIDGDKVMEWLESWGTKDEKDPPQG
jgi:predicted transcriptional regulator